MPKHFHSAEQLLDVYSIGRKLHILRILKHLTLSRLAADVGFYSPSIQARERPDDSNIADTCNALQGVWC